MPLYEGSIEHIVGIIHLKDLLCLKIQTGQQGVREAMRPVLFVPETMPVDKVFSELQNKRYHVATVLDEFGGTSGIVTLEDLIEEIFGELQDEFDTDTTPLISVLQNNQIRVRGDMLVADLNEIMDLRLPCVGIDTVGGLVLSLLGRVPEQGENVDLGEISCVVDEMDGYGVTAIQIEATPKQIARVRKFGYHD
jgi:CBS domain containing-hemolysin-like protein